MNGGAVIGILQAAEKRRRTGTDFIRPGKLSMKTSQSGPVAVFDSGSLLPEPSLCDLIPKWREGWHYVSHLHLMKVLTNIDRRF
jgi:hypothetical protein